MQGQSWYVRATDDDVDNALDFRLLGPLEVLRNGQEVTLGGGRQRSLLAVLLVHANEVVSNDRLIDELWGAQPPETAATALHGVVSQLRKSLEPDRAPGAPGATLVTRTPGYQLRVERRAVDASRFDDLLTDGRAALDAGEAARAAATLRDALGLWRGQALDGADEAPSAHAEALRLEELRLEALEERIDADLALGRDEELVPELEALVEREPLREKLQAQLMLALYRAGRQADALERYQRARATFRDRLGIEPSPRLRELEQAMLRQDPELDEGLPRVRPRRVLRRRRRALAIALAAILLVLAAVATAFVLTRPDSSIGGSPGSVAVIDPELGRVFDTIEVGSGPAAIVSGHGSIWVANSEDDTVSRIDPASSHVVKVIGVPSPVDLAVGPDAVWVAGGLDGTVSRIDPRSNDVVAEIDLGGDDPLLPLTVQGVAADARAAWVCVGSELVRIDASTNRPVDSLDVDAPTLAVAVGHGSVWLLTGAFRLLRIEPSSLVTTARTPVSGFPFDVVSTDDGVVVLSFAGSSVAWLVSPETARIARPIGSADGASGVADVPGPGFWVSTFDGVARLVGPGRPSVTAEVTTGSPQTAVAVASGRAWVTLDELEP